MPKRDYPNTAISPALHKAAIAKSDVTVYSPPMKGLYVGTAGDVTLRAPESSADVVYKNVPSGGYIDGFISMVKNATTAADLVGDF